MKLKDISSVFNMGDTSFRRKTLLEDYKVLLPLLIVHKELYPTWEKNNEAQAEYFKTVVNNTKFFTEASLEANPAKRGRTLTNALIKPGLINEKRELSEVALNWVKNSNSREDKLEKLMSLYTDNLVFFRQFYKLRVYEPNGLKYFYPFRVALEFLSKYKDVRENDLLLILHLVSPEIGEEKLHEIINVYQKVVDEEITFEKFFDNYLDNMNDEKTLAIEKARNIFSQENLNEDEFWELFKNNKSKQFAYLDFYKALQEYRNTKSYDSLKALNDISKNPAIKKAFGFNQLPFKFPRTNKFTSEEFEKLNVNHKLLSDKKEDFYIQFTLSKKADLVREYSDMTKRTFALSGIISFDKGLVNLTQPWIIESLLKVAGNEINLTGIEDIKNYEGNIESDFYKDITLAVILNLSAEQVLDIENIIKQKFGVTDVTTLEYQLEQEQENRFRKVIEKDFPRKTVSELLRLFSDRSIENDREIQSIVTDSATVPTIFEYVLAIAWFYIAEKKFSLRKSVNLSLDGNFKPLTHAVGGDGDIVIEFDDVTLMLEATLMDINSQKRGELEPVIRHTANLAIRDNKRVLTIFVADKLDSNVINIFRASSFIEFESTQQRDKTIKGIDIFALRILELVTALEKKISQSRIIEVVEKYYKSSPVTIYNGWREEIVEQIFS
ncbi:AlwI family type II restriction endonuclease [Anaerocolumna cellulosilytica]|uniref:AlwI family type II restriction endonuclease n=1 Tax=Anaerocolumna cellulosilytica TaxID=433286 RepID=A0A6S6R2T1_9FIRM|nr:AlwI family type II restriction endonuclease [Anaerocolumna cellulosilytica]MBB5195558.1 hypothetical protein [Anaerocolumna cellulosilytica]BCJ93802.1 AlwI family type II restriction endonuclease [Anaerocolumna cellulosilytica]